MNFLDINITRKSSNNKAVICSRDTGNISDKKNFDNQEVLKVHKNENFFGFDFEFCPISLLVMHK